MSDFKSSDRIRRSKHEKNYTVILNSTIQDSRLSWKARGLHHYILSLPDDWDICIAHLAEQSEPDGEAIVKSALKELEANGYLTKTRLKDDRGRFSKCVWDIYESPQGENQLMDKPRKRKASKKSPQVDYPQVDKPQVDKPSMDKPRVDEPLVENRTLINTYKQSTNNEQSTYLQKSDFSQIQLSDRITQMRQAEQDKWTQPRFDCRALSKDDDFAEYIKTVYLPTVPEYRGKEIGISTAKTWIVRGQRDPARRDVVEIQLEAFEVHRSNQQKKSAIAATKQKDDRPRLRKPNPLTWTAEQENWTYEQWEKYLHEQNQGDTPIYAASY